MTCANFFFEGGNWRPDSYRVESEKRELEQLGGFWPRKKNKLPGWLFAKPIKRCSLLVRITLNYFLLYFFPAGIASRIL